MEARHQKELAQLPVHSNPSPSNQTEASGWGNGVVGGAMSDAMQRMDLEDGVEEGEGTGKKSKAQKRKVCVHGFLVPT